jgi:hypothetical protein
MTTARKFGTQLHDGRVTSLTPSRKGYLEQRTDTVSRLSDSSKQYAFKGVERMGTVFAYDFTDPAAPRLVRHSSAPRTDVDDEAGELDVESVILVNATESLLAGGAPVRIVGNEIFGTIAVFSVSAA